MPWGVPGCPNVEFNEWLGYFQPGDMLPLRFVAIDKHSQSSTPSASPTYQVFDSTGQDIFGEIKMPIRNRYAFDTSGADFNYFEHHIPIDWLAAGSHMALIRYAIGGVGYRVTRTFWINDSGGDTDGQVLSLDRLARPEADYVLYQYRARNLRAGRNPH